MLIFESNLNVFFEKDILPKRLRFTEEIRHGGFWDFASWTKFAGK